jgi:hypothetical protein
MKMKRVMHVIILSLICLGTGCAGSGSGVAVSSADAVRKESPPGETREACLKAIRQARIDARLGAYRMYVRGTERYNGDFARFLAEYMQTRYGIELVIFGAEDRERNRCYSNEMDKIIFNTFGASILATAEQEARDIFGSRK